MRPSVSVLITYYGERELLRDCLMSLLSGSDQPDEILIHDDASPFPATEHVPSGIPARVIRSEVNRGPAAGRNILLEESLGDYVHFHDADDLFAPEWCARVRQTIADARSDAVFTEITSIHDGRPFADRVLGLSHLRKDPDLLRFCLRGSMLVPAGTFRRQLVQRIGGYDTRLWQAEDFDFHVRLAASGVSYHVIDESLIITRLRSDSRSQRQYEVWSYAVDAIDGLVERLPSAYRPELADAAARAGSMLFRLGYLQDSRRAFGLASRLGKPHYQGFPLSYRCIAVVFGQEVAERVSQHYRGLLPRPVRAGLRHIAHARSTP